MCAAWFGGGASVVDHPEPDAPSTDAYDKGADGMPDRTRRAFQAHAQQQLGTKPKQAIAEIERVYKNNPDSVVACSGGKDSMAVLVLAAASDAEHHALHFDWGRRFVPRDLEQEIVANIRAYVPDERLYVASYERAHFEPYPENKHFRQNLDRAPGGKTYEGVGKLAGALRHCDDVSQQLVGLRAGESGGRERKLDGLYGESLGQPAAFPIRDWSARDVWAFLIDREVSYCSYYDRVAHATGDGSPRDYEQARLSTVHDPEFENYHADGLTAWRDYDLKQS